MSDDSRSSSYARLEQRVAAAMAVLDAATDDEALRMLAMRNLVSQAAGFLHFSLEMAERLEAAVARAEAAAARLEAQSQAQSCNVLADK